MPIRKLLYRAQATAIGGREGSAPSSVGVLKVRLSPHGNLVALAGAIPTGFGIEVDLQISRA